jgi:hypothetical protein
MGRPFESLSDMMVRLLERLSFTILFTNSVVGYFGMALGKRGEDNNRNVPKTNGDRKILDAIEILYKMKNEASDSGKCT